MERYYLTAQEGADALGVKIGMAYKLIRQWNTKLAAEGKLTIRGKINKKFFEKQMEA